MNVLIVVATPAEAEALHVPNARSVARVVVSGVGATAAALATWQALTAQPCDLVVSAGIAGAYPGSGLQAGDLAVSSRIVQADLGAQDGPHFLPLAQLNLSVFPDRSQGADFEVWSEAQRFAHAAGAACGPLLTLNTVTGAHARAEELTRLYPGALTEGMEGAGVAHAATLLGVPALELRGVSNPVGPRDRHAWRIREALDAARHGLSVLLN
ncbi:futalosine hydrolase [Deinococcus fonticola]|uniref:futalosine hydrolase n=1 Tax=Deinococcus fonticola TaxID=2528713 RepID=UPI001074D54C|nr:futalosine hydrolase [Deinococcus fonticola]